MEDKRLFPGLPEDFDALDVEKLQELLKEYRSIGKRVLDRDPELLGEMSRREVLEQYRTAAEESDQIVAQLELLGQADTEFEASLEELSQRVGVTAEDDDEPEEPGPDNPEPAEPEVVAEEQVAEADDVEKEGIEVPADGTEVELEVAEPVLAGGSLPAAGKKKAPLPAPTPERQPLEELKPTASIVASAGISGIREGAELDRISLAQAIIKRREASVSTPNGVEEKAIVASVNFGEMFPEERKLNGEAADQEKIQAVVAPEAITAAGGLCAPVTPYYDLANVSTTARPVRDALAGFVASRGGLRFAAVPTLVDVDVSGSDAAVGIRTAAQDAAGGTSAQKSCQIVACPDFEEALLSMIYHCVQFGNLNSRAWPEQVAQFNDLVMAAHARVAETALLDGIASYSTGVTSAKVYGATNSLLYTILRAAAGMRSRHRMAPGTRLRVLMPAWTADLLVADLVNSEFERFEYTVTGVEQLLSSLGAVNVTWYLDQATGTGQIFGAQGTGPVLDFPDTVVWFIFPEGSFLFLDGGTLELGIVRDSTLNNTNDYRIFGESFEQVAFVGVESLEVTSTVCPTGETGPNPSAFSC